MQVQFFKIPLGEKILVKEMNRIYKITWGFKSVFVSSLGGNPFQDIWL
jgi:hypothetical protein